MIRKILIANRGEIAVRVIKTARELGYRTVAVYSEADAQAMHVQCADEAVLIGPSPASESYLQQDAVLDAAKRTGADAIHPGYGFLSENADFARACHDAGVIFIGPPASAIELMGSKRRSKVAMQEAGVPVVPGFEEANASDEALIRAAGTLGFPVMIKASAGGGGRGMRQVESADQLADQIRTARSESRNAFGDDELILEKAVIEPRHIEIQVFADSHGNAVYLGERDCSIQRRHQKVVEEAPSPFVTPALRQTMGEAAVRAAQACNYVGAGTVEFLVDAERNFYFLEMNTRLQVEHPVTELITGQDLVAWQIAVADQKPLPLTQDGITLTGHAIEVRLYAEDPAAGFTPQTGLLEQFTPAMVPGVRFDSGVRSGDTITPFYDPMLAKVVAHGDDREEARRRLLMTLEDTQIIGLTTNRYFLGRVINHPEFIAGHATTAFLATAFAGDESLNPIEPTRQELGLAAIALSQPSAANDQRWSNSLPTPQPICLAIAARNYDLFLTSEGNDTLIQSGGDTLTLTLHHRGADYLDYTDQGVRQRCHYRRQGDDLYLHLNGRSMAVSDVTHTPAATSDRAASDRLLATMDGAIVDVKVKAGDRVARGETLVVLEAMKMEHPLVAERDGEIAQVHVTHGTQVKRRQVLVELSTPEEETGT